MRLPHEEFKILLYGPDLPATGARGRAHFESGVLILHGSGHWYTAPLSDLGLKTGGYDGRQWLLTWNSPIGEFTAMLQGDSAVDSFIKRAPEALAERLHLVRNQQRTVERKFRFGLAAVALAFAVPVLALLLFWLNADAISGWAARQITSQQEQQLGDLVFANMREKLLLLPEDSIADNTVERVGVRLTGGLQQRYIFHVADDPQINAFALPGGHVVVNTGLLRQAGCADELAGVLAHEASHVELRHSMRGLIHQAGLGALLALSLGDMSGLAATLAAELASLAYSRDLEREADRHALTLLRRAGIPADGMLRFFEKLAEDEKSAAAKGVATPEMFATHPSSSARLLELREAIDAQGPYLQKPIVLDWIQLKSEL